MGGQVWEVVGGSEKGGVIVRVGAEFDARPFPDRLSTGALVREVSLEGTRLQFERISGAGPGAGWVSTNLPSGKELLVRHKQHGGPGAATGKGKPDASDGVERRRFPDGQLYSKQEALEFYGSTAQWDSLAAAAPEGRLQLLNPLRPRKAPLALWNKPEVNLPICNACGEQIKGQFAIVQDKRFHFDCFKCDTCNKKISGQFFPAQSGRYICEQCMAPQLPTCSKCQKPIPGEAISAEGKQFHAQCFTCDECHRSIRGNYFPEGDSIICEVCIDKRLPQCCKCHRAIRGEGKAVEDKVFHTDCFRCMTCMRPITGTFFPDGGRFKCEKCVMNSLPKCARCFKAITDDMVTVENKVFHPECFKCSSCGKRITGTFFMPAHGNRIYCEFCEEEQLPRCCRCSQPIKGNAITAEGKAYHTNCFKCEACKKVIGGLYYPDKGKRILCEPCYADQCPKCAWCCQAIMEQYTTAEGNCYHVNCFACSACGNSIRAQYYRVKDRNNEDHFVCKKCHDGPAPRCRGCREPITGAYLVADGAQYHHSCFKCSGCMQQIKGRYVIRQSCPICAECCVGAVGDGGKKNVAGRGSIDASPDKWAASRLPTLQQELRELLRYSPKDRKKRLRALQLELHPDKQVDERRQHAQPLFLLVQAEWEATEKEEKGQKANRSNGAGRASQQAASEEWHHFREAYHAHAES